MRLATLKNGHTVVITAKSILPLRKLGFNGNLLDLIIAGKNELEKIKNKIINVNESIIIAAEGLAAPYKNPPKIVAIGLNYLDHANEAKMQTPKTPLAFAKYPSSIIGPTDDIIIPTAVTKKVDYEVELAVVIGKEAKNVSMEKALDYVFGYTILNDISARDVQFSESQWVRAKSIDSFCPLGPVIVTADEIPNPQNLELGCEVNGKIMQSDSTKNMIFNVASLISILSHSFKFEPGDIIATGTPSGVGFSRKPPVFLKTGDIVKSWIKGIGEMINQVKES
jgi:2-keto-4-pentenoate hydratase/2-oxohepta-3-ene-1,7-dioic acid hydratase in catechol pathway